MNQAFHSVLIHTARGGEVLRAFEESNIGELEEEVGRGGERAHECILVIEG